MMSEEQRERTIRSAVDSVDKDDRNEFLRSVVHRLKPKAQIRLIGFHAVGMSEDAKRKLILEQLSHVLPHERMEIMKMLSMKMDPDDLENYIRGIHAAGVRALVSQMLEGLMRDLCAPPF